MVPLIRIGPAAALGLAALGLLFGGWLKRRLPFLERINMPASIAGGLAYSLLALALRDRVVNFDPDMTLRDLFQIAFFTTIGLGASTKLLRQGGLALLGFWALATAGAVLQNALGIGIARAFGINPLFGVIAGSAALAGGPATTLAFGGTFERLGVAGATSVGIAAATFGITAAGILSGWVGGRLIKPGTDRPVPSAARGQAGLSPVCPASLATHILAIAAAMGIGAAISAQIERTGVVLPAYIGAMIAAAVIRALDDRFGVTKLSPARLAEIGSIALSFFIVIALLGLKLWELARLAVPLIVMLALQVVLVLALSAAVVWRSMGRNRDAAVTTAGFCGFMLGITANALAAMDELVQRYGPAPRAFLIVPVVGAFLIDFTNALVITVTVNVIR